MNRKLVVLAVTGAVVLAGCARMMAQQPKSEAMRPATRMEAQSAEMSQAEAPKAEAPKTEAPRPKPKRVPRTSRPHR